MRMQGVLLIVFFVVGAVSLFVAMSNHPVALTQASSTSKNSALQVVATAVSPNDVAKKFYESYRQCIVSPPPESKGSETTYCQLHSDLTSAHFSQANTSTKVASGTTDPIFCSANVPDSFDVSDIVVTGDVAHVDIFAIFGGTQIKIPVALILENSEWKIDSINCPKS
jgi:hypothetical protein